MTSDSASQLSRIKIPELGDLRGRLEIGDFIDILAMPVEINSSNVMDDWPKPMIAKTEIRAVDNQSNEVAFDAKGHLTILPLAYEMLPVFHDPQRLVSLFTDRLRGVWRVVSTRVDQVNRVETVEMCFAFYKNEVMMFPSIGEYQRMKMSLDLRNENEAMFKANAMVDDSVGSELGTIRFLPSGKLEVDYGLSDTRPDNNKFPKMTFRLERVKTPKTNTEKQATRFMATANQFEKEFGICIGVNKQKAAGEPDPLFFGQPLQGEEMLISPAFVSNKDLLFAKKRKNERGEWGIIIELTQQAGAKMNWLTSIYRGENLIFEIDGKVVKSGKLFDQAIGQNLFLQLDCTEVEAEEIVKAIMPRFGSVEGLTGFEDAAIEQTSDNLRKIVFALHNYESTNGSLPASRKMINGHPVSWRVLILPFLGAEESKLFSKYRLDEPWDSEHNLREVAAHQPEVYRHPKDRNSAFTSYVTVVGEGAAMQTDNATKLSDFPDGMSDTILVVETETSIDWTNPLDFSIDWGLAAIKSRYGDRLPVAKADGSVQFLSMEKLNDGVFKKMLTRKGGDTFDQDKYSFGD